MRQPQEVTIIWMPYPENKPKIDGYYLICNEIRVSGDGLWGNNQWYIPSIYDNGGDEGEIPNIVAYAELPEGYKEDK